MTSNATQGLQVVVANQRRMLPIDVIIGNQCLHRRRIEDCLSEVSLVEKNTLYMFTL